MDTGEKLKQMRELKKITVQKMADHLQCSRQTVYNIENNSPTSWELVQKWVQITEPNIEHLLNLFEEDNTEQQPVLPRWLAKILPNQFLRLVKTGELHGNQTSLHKHGNDHALSDSHEN